ncbi:MAG: helix-turn-helix domain-containing protein [Candidatus Berkelbacteria bacterium]|nr:MAG: helix-turn-helix domain-containing protein [Candidatus Berkelbacteria bacterium]QQG51751.1 MAG: helix-turn-helix domain-containing protein [Candidatus Berkelbacteria bacterium]
MTGFVTKKIHVSKSRSLGSLLKAARTKASVTLEEAEAQTRIRLKYLEALENGNYSSLPAEAYNVGFVRCYAEFLHLNPEKIIRLYREERSQKRLLPERAVNFAPAKVSDWRFLITPRAIGIISAVLLFGGILGYIVVQLKQFTRPPEISLSGVSEEFTTGKDTVSLNGSTTEGSVVLMNNQPVLVSPSGQFSQEVQLSPGVNQVVISAKNRAGNERQKVVKVLYNPNLALNPPNL